MSQLQKLPLFPLSTVLFPGMMLPLHIFEDRYKKMVGDCLRDNVPFGVVLIQDGSEVGSGATIFNIGTTALITQVEELDNGRLNIATLGMKRFKILEVYSDKEPYLVGLVEDFPFAENDAQLVMNQAQTLSPILKNYLETLAAVSDLAAPIGRMPDDAITLACLAAIILQTPLQEKQTLLSLPTLDEVLRVECELLLQEALTLKLVTHTAPRWKEDPVFFSPN